MFLALCLGLSGKPLRKAASRRRPAFRRPLLEELEARALPSAYVVTTTADGGPGSLRDAINQINADTTGQYLGSQGVDEIDFDLTAASDTGGGFNSATGIATIAPLSQLPTITNAVLIDGYTQAGAQVNTLLGPCALGSTDSTLNPQNYGDNAVLKIELDGANAGTSFGVVLDTSNITVQGLVINRFAAVGLLVYDVGSDIIQGNFLGTDVTGTQALGNGGADIDDHFVNNVTIGGTTPAARNIISAALNDYPVAPDNSGGEGIMLFGRDTVVQGNFIGTDRTGRIALGNATAGINQYDDGGNLIGGSVAGAGNVISGNVVFGVGGDDGGAPDVYQGNFIGTDVTGTQALGNGLAPSAPAGGVVAAGTSFVIGGPGAGNLISGNSDGIEITSSGTLIQGNYIGTDVTGTQALSNGMGIRSGIGPYLGGYAGIGPSTDCTIGGTVPGAGNLISGNANAAVYLGGSTTGDSILGNSIHDNGTGIVLASGGNDDQAAPVLVSISGHAHGTTVTGSLSSVPSTSFRIEFFSSATPDDSAYGEGQTYLGSTTVTTDANGHAAISAGPLIPAGQPYLSATATNLSTGDTSEFSLDLNASTGTPLSPSTITVTNSNDSGPGSFRRAIFEATALADVQSPITIVFKIPTTDPRYQSSNNTIKIAVGWALPTLPAGAGIDLTQETARLQTTFTVTNTAPTGGGSLDQVISDASQSPEYLGPNEIDFDIPWNDPGHVYYRGQVNRADVTPVPANTSSDADLANASVVGSDNTIAAAWPCSWWTIDLSQTEFVGQPIILDGYSQPGSSPNTSATGDNAVLRIEVNGSQIAPQWFNNYLYGVIGLNFGVTDSTVTGIAFNGFNCPDPTSGFPSGTTAAHAVSAVINGSGDQNDVFAGNFFGTDVSGTLAVPNSWAIWLYSSGPGTGSKNRIGMDSPQDYADRNIISGNSASGVAIFLNGADDNLVAGNLIGTDRHGNPLGNGAFGVVVEWGAQFNQIGGEGGLGNVIAYNGGNAQFFGSAVGGAGVLVADTNYTQQQYFQLPTGFNSTTGNTIEGNAIYGNAGLGIDLASSNWDMTGAITGIVASIVNTPTWLGEALNDSQGHSGPNNWQNFPVLTSASSSGTDTSVAGTFSEAAEPNTAITLDFYANPAPDPSGYGQGQTYLGETTVTTDANGNATFTADLAAGSLAGQWITATATDPSGDTSEFSADEQATAAPSQSYAQYLQGALPQSSTTANSMTIQASAAVTPATVIPAVNGLTNVTQPVTIILDLGGGNYSSGGAVADPPPNVTFVVQNGTLDPAYPALTVSGGQVSLLHCTLTTSGDAPTLLVTGGHVTLLDDDIIQASTVFTEPAIAVTGGTVNLGTQANPGNNTLSVGGAGDLVSNTSGNAISAVGDTFVIGGTVATAPSLSFTTAASSAATSLLNQAVTFAATVRPDGAGTPTGRVDFFDATTSSDLGSVALSGGTASLTTRALAAGSHVIQVRYGGDATFLPSLAVVVQSVHYNFGGFLAPLYPNMAYALGRTIPIKFQLTDYYGASVTSLSAVMSLQVLSAQGNDVLAGAGKTGLRAAGNQFIYNWQTKGLANGTYTVLLALADGTTQALTLTLSSNGAFQLADGASSAYVSSAANQVLFGELTVAVQDDTGAGIDPNELARISDALAYLNAALGSFGVDLTWAAAGAVPDVTIHFANSTPEGGAADGVLGFTTAANDVYFAEGWSFYTGSDPSQVGAGQYDFQTLATHELAHTVGLGESSDPGSVMYEYLSPGTARRSFTAGNLTLINSDADRYMKVAGNARGGGVPAASQPTSGAPGSYGEASGLLPGAGGVAAWAPAGIGPPALFLDAWPGPGRVAVPDAGGGAGLQLVPDGGVLIGGRGDDLRIGGGGRDLLVGGYQTDPGPVDRGNGPTVPTTTDASLTARDAALAGWASAAADLPDRPLTADGAQERAEGGLGAMYACAVHGDDTTEDWAGEGDGDQLP
jgi:hypothetical protein